MKSLHAHILAALADGQWHLLRDIGLTSAHMKPGSSARNLIDAGTVEQTKVYALRRSGLRTPMTALRLAEQPHA